MATVISSLFIALDGVVEIDPAWHFPYYDEHMGAAVTEDYAGTDVIVLGRVTYDSFAGAWPDREAAGEADADFARQLGDTRKLVVTRDRGRDLGWRNAQALDGELVDVVTRLKADPRLSKVLVAGSTSVVRQLLDARLVDELRLLVHPVAARAGERLFTEAGSPYPLRLLRSEAFPTGVLRLVYAPGELGDAGYAEARENLARARAAD
ncbi:dihydrofolate reductase family protein [Puerhibacterium puerhi]|uniref:dihydrofolate reductase family protein n=1 Tax=Puerhibacterium puerhi TaxID=2692623 RepID=UPI00135A323A|nr:dihydrofolate reductase family protein [Puerhibacterium puerhi]